MVKMNGRISDYSESKNIILFKLKYGMYGLYDFMYWPK